MELETMDYKQALNQVFDGGTVLGENFSQDIVLKLNEDKQLSYFNKKIGIESISVFINDSFKNQKFTKDD